MTSLRSRSDPPLCHGHYGVVILKLCDYDYFPRRWAPHASRLLRSMGVLPLPLVVIPSSVAHQRDARRGTSLRMSNPPGVLAIMACKHSCKCACEFFFRIHFPTLLNFVDFCSIPPFPLPFFVIFCVR